MTKFANDQHQHQGTTPAPKSKGGLVLWRSKGKTIQIGDDIFITLLSMNDHSGARLRIQAPANLKISRLDQID